MTNQIVKDPSTVVFQLETKELLISFRDLLKGVIRDDKGNIIHKRQKQYLNDEEIHDLLMVLNSGIDKNILLSNFDDKAIQIVVGSLMRSVVKYLRVKKDMPLETKDLVCDSMFAMLYSAARRALNQGERRSVTETNLTRTSILKQEQDPRNQRGFFNFDRR